MEKNGKSGKTAQGNGKVYSDSETLLCALFYKVLLRFISLKKKHNSFKYQQKNKNKMLRNKYVIGQRPQPKNDHKSR